MQQRNRRVNWTFYEAKKRKYEIELLVVKSTWIHLFCIPRRFKCRLIPSLLYHYVTWVSVCASMYVLTSGKSLICDAFKLNLIVSCKCQGLRRKLCTQEQKALVNVSFVEKGRARAPIARSGSLIIVALCCCHCCSASCSRVGRKPNYGKLDVLSFYHCQCVSAILDEVSVFLYLNMRRLIMCTTWVFMYTVLIITSIAILLVFIC